MSFAFWPINECSEYSDHDVEVHMEMSHNCVNHNAQTWTQHCRRR